MVGIGRVVIVVWKWGVVVYMCRELIEVWCDRKYIDRGGWIGVRVFWIDRYMENDI